MMKFLLSISVLLGMALFVSGQHVCSSQNHECQFVSDFKPVVCYEKNGVKSIQLPPPVCVASDEVHRTSVPPPESFLLKSAAAKSDIVVTYVGFSDEAKAAVEHAVEIWETIIESEVPIRMKATWSSTMQTNTLASCGPETYYANFENAPLKNVYYPVAVAEKITGTEMNGITRYDLLASFNSKINWYYGTDLNTPTTSYDLVSVALHEIAHGLGFTGFFFVENGQGDYGFFDFGDLTSYDVLVENFGRKALGNPSFYERQTAKLANALQSESLYSGSPVASSSNSGNRPKLYAPSEFNDGSSIYHLNESTYPAGDDNSLMTYAAARGEAIHNPGPLATGILEDIGWTNLWLRHDPVKDKEQPAPLNFVANVESYYPIPKSAARVIYSIDNFVSHRDTLALVQTGTENEFANGITLGNGVEGLDYYVEVSDSKGRVRTSPMNAPLEVHKVHFGVDNEAPQITHINPEYFLFVGEALEIEAEVDDNLGVDTVFVLYSINGVEQIPFGLSWQKQTRYSGVFNFDPESLNDGDQISYRIVARDASAAQNEASYPVSGNLSFTIEKIFDPVSFYTNNFNYKTRDILSADFDVYTATGFSNGALHSPHPYPSPNKDNHEFNLVALLKQPIILKDQGMMSFDEVVLVETGTGGYGSDTFWDYVVVEGSKDEGVTWYNLADGYDASANPTWDQNFNASIVKQESKAVGIADWLVNREIELTKNGIFAAGDTIWIRFRLYSDPYANGWGWVIDNLRIQQPLSTGGPVLSPGNINVYPNPFQNKFRIDIDLSGNIDELRIELYDAFGRVVHFSKEEHVSGRVSEVMDFSNQPPGIYLLRVMEEGRPVLSKKLIKN